MGPFLPGIIIREIYRESFGLKQNSDEIVTYE